jgi:hypothetical protein
MKETSVLKNTASLSPPCHLHFAFSVLHFSLTEQQNVPASVPLRPFFASCHQTATSERRVPAQNARSIAVDSQTPAFYHPTTFPGVPPRILENFSEYLSQSGKLRRKSSTGHTTVAIVTGLQRSPALRTERATPDQNIVHSLFQVVEGKARKPCEFCFRHDFG